MSTQALPLSRESEIYKTLLVYVLGMLTALIGAYLMQAHNTVTRDEVPALVKQNNPYSEDQQVIKQSLAELKEESRDHGIELREDSRKLDKIGMTLHIKSE